MPATVVRPQTPPAPAGSAAPVPGAAVAYEHLLHRLVRRELRVLTRLSTGAPADDAGRTAALTAHADLMGRLLLRHHATERELIWPAVLRALPPGDAEASRAAVADWTTRCARLDHLLRGLSTAARQWTVARSAAARDAFATACHVLADAVAEQTAAEERDLLPPLAALPAAQWRAIAAAAGAPLSGRERTLVLGLALEDAGPDEKARLLAALSPATRLAWRVTGRRRYRAAVVRLRGEPPSA